MTDAKPYQIRGTLQTILALRVDEPDAPAFFDRLRDDVLRSPGFFKNAPIIIDVHAIVDRSPLDLRKFVARVRACELQPIGIMGGDEAWNEAARAVGLSVLAAGRPSEVAPEETEARPAEPPPTPSPPSPVPSLLVENVVRSGQQVYAPHGDLVCTSPVSNGAEVVAAGHVHIYAPLRGRAFAGFDGDRRAMIFCDRLEADLVSVAGYHLVRDELPEQAIGKRARIRLDGDRLVIDVMP
jgi:septum site-determining protein MinC